MPSSDSTVSRRDALAALGSAATLSLAGCIDVAHASTALCQWKAVDVTWHHRGRTFGDDVVWVIGEPGSLYGRVAEEVPGLAGDVRSVDSDESVHRRLDRSFVGVDYLLGFCGDAFSSECRNTAAASRGDFNAVQVGDEARVSLVGHEFHVHSADAPGGVADWETEFHRIDFSGLHADHGVPLDD